MGKTQGTVHPKANHSPGEPVKSNNYVSPKYHRHRIDILVTKEKKNRKEKRGNKSQVNPKSNKENNIKS